MVHLVTLCCRMLLLGTFVAVHAPTTSLAQAPAGGDPLARIDLAIPGVTMEVLSLARLANHPVVELRFNLVNNGQRPASLGDLGMISTDPALISGLQLLDLANGTGYRIGQLSSRNLASFLPHPLNTIGPGERREGLWAWFGAPPAAVTRLTLNVPGGAPAVDMPIRSR